MPGMDVQYAYGSMEQHQLAAHRRQLRHRSGVIQRLAECRARIDGCNLVRTDDERFGILRCDRLRLPTRQSRGKRGRFLDSWRRLGLRSAAGFAVILLMVAYWTVLAPFGLIARRTRTHVEGWRGPRKASSLSGQY